MNHEFKKIGVIGLGYIGLPTAATLASRGIEVIGVDTNPKVVERINQGKTHLVEPDLDVIVQAVTTTGKLKALLEPEPTDAFIIAVPTPLTENHHPDTSYIKKAANNLAPILKKGNLIILESTSPVGTTEKLVEWLKESRPDLVFPSSKHSSYDIHVAYCPERVLPGQVLNELVNNDRVIGGISLSCAEKAKELYNIFVRGECLLTDTRTAEMTKLIENTFRDVNIALANELSIICDKLKINVWRLIELANRHPRVNILHPGPGVGGHCIAVDPWFIVHSIPEHSRLIRTAREVNDEKSSYVLERIKKKAARFKSPVIACLGLAFKADIDDLRESPALEIVKKLAEDTVGDLLIVEPYIDKFPQELADFQKLKLVETDYAFQYADIIVLLVNHQLFNEIDRSLLQDKIVLDTRGVWT